MKSAVGAMTITPQEAVYGLLQDFGFAAALEVRFSVNERDNISEQVRRSRGHLEQICEAEILAGCAYFVQHRQVWDTDLQLDVQEMHPSRFEQVLDTVDRTLLHEKPRALLLSINESDLIPEEKLGFFIFGKEYRTPLIPRINLRNGDFRQGVEPYIGYLKGILFERYVSMLFEDKLPCSHIFQRYTYEFRTANKPKATRDIDVLVICDAYDFNQALYRLNSSPAITVEYH